MNTTPTAVSSPKPSGPITVIQGASGSIVVQSGNITSPGATPEKDKKVVYTPHYTNVETSRVAAFRGANYSRTQVPPTSNRFHTSYESLVQRKIAHALQNSKLDTADPDFKLLDWALGVLVVRSTVDYVLKPSHRVLDLLLICFHICLTKSKKLTTSNENDKEDVMEVEDSNNAKDVNNGADGSSVKTETSDESISRLLNVEDVQLDMAPIVWKQTFGTGQERYYQYLCHIAAILRNLSCTHDNEKYLTGHANFIQSAMQLLYHEDSELAKYGLEIMYNLSSSIVLNTQSEEFLSFLFGFLYNLDVSMVTMALDTFIKLSEMTPNHNVLGKMDITFYRRLEQLLCHSNRQIVEQTATLLMYLSRFGSMRARVLIAQETRIIKVLVGLIVYQNQRKVLPSLVVPLQISVNITLNQARFVLSERAASILYHLALEPKNRVCFAPYTELFIDLSLNDLSVATIMTELLLAIGDEAY